MAEADAIGCDATTTFQTATKHIKEIPIEIREIDLERGRVTGVDLMNNTFIGYSNVTFTREGRSVNFLSTLRTLINPLRKKKKNSFTQQVFNVICLQKYFIIFIYIFNIIEQEGLLLLFEG